MHSLNAHHQGVVHLYIYFSAMCWCASQREIEKLIAVCYCTARLIVRIHNIRVRALCENKLQSAGMDRSPAAAHAVRLWKNNAAVPRRRAMGSGVTEKLPLSMDSCFSTGVPINFAAESYFFSFRRLIIVNAHRSI
jgi:hypothetical protein